MSTTAASKAGLTTSDYSAPFRSSVWVASLAARPPACRCTWVYRFGGYALKFRDRECPEQRRHG